MKIKYLVWGDLILIFLIFSFALLGSSFNYADSSDYLLFVLLLPHAIMIPPSVWYITFFKILKAAGDDSAIVRTYRFSTVVVVFFVFFTAIIYLYSSKIELSGDGVMPTLLLYLTVISHSLGLSTATLVASAAYTMFIRMSARGYKKLMK